jgi:hypothetical protein
MSRVNEWIIQRRDEDLAQAELAGANEALPEHRQGLGTPSSCRAGPPGLLSVNMSAEAEMTDTDVPDPDVTVRDTEVDPIEQQPSGVRHGTSGVRRFIAEFGGLYNDKGTRHRVILYYEGHAPHRRDVSLLPGHGDHRRNPGER